MVLSVLLPAWLVVRLLLSQDVSWMQLRLPRGQQAVPKAEKTGRNTKQKCRQGRKEFDIHIGRCMRSVWSGEAIDEAVTRRAEYIFAYLCIVRTVYFFMCRV